ncbi:MAG: NAD-dependent epimerase/dehydratase family protein [Pseudolabrys sp.]
MPERILVTGGAGFVGSTLALAFKRNRSTARVVVLDNLKRRGSELALERLRASGVEFAHGDVRASDDLAAIGPVDLLIEASAEPSVHAGYDGNPSYLIHSNLVGAVNCLEHARRHGSAFVFLSSSRVYPIASLRALPLARDATRFVLHAAVDVPGVTVAGISERFPLSGSRSLYGATKLAAELLIEEYKAMYGVRALVNRCGVITGPWQMGKVDQGFIVLWMARHLFGGALAYMGFGGEGLQVRDVLHVDDLYDLLAKQLAELDRHSGQASYNVGGGMENSVSLRELTQFCQELSGKRIEIGRIAETRDADIPFYVSDCTAVHKATDWKPKRKLSVVLENVWQWLVDHREQLEPILR